MSVWRLVLIECDGGGGFDRGCDKTWRSTTDDYDQAIADAAKRGWTRDNDTDEDFCPEHGEA